MIRGKRAPVVFQNERVTMYVLRKHKRVLSTVACPLHTKLAR